MYTRNFGKQKYTPPPGYDGTAFSGAVSTKHHEPTELIRAEQEIVEIIPEIRSDPEPDLVIIENTEKEIKQKETHEFKQIQQLLQMMRGKLGTEELIILLVMLLIASEGFSAEMLVLGILLVI